MTQETITAVANDPAVIRVILKAAGQAKSGQDYADSRRDRNTVGLAGDRRETFCLHTSGKINGSGLPTIMWCSLNWLKNIRQRASME